jgi:hypothetical protein
MGLNIVKSWPACAAANVRFVEFLAKADILLPTTKLTSRAGNVDLAGTAKYSAVLTRFVDCKNLPSVQHIRTGQCVAGSIQAAFATKSRETAVLCWAHFAYGAMREVEIASAMLIAISIS